MKLVLLFLLCISYISTVLSCVCIQRRFQTKFCSSSFVIFAVPISRVSAQNLFSDVIYTLFVFGVTKGGDQLVPFSLQRAITGASGAQCGAYLQLFKPYVISGSLTQNTTVPMRLSSCQINKQLSDLTQCELNFLRGQNNRRSQLTECFDCSCTIKLCTNENNTKQCPPDRNVCYWNPQDYPNTVFSCQRDWFSWGCSWKSC